MSRHVVLTRTMPQQVGQCRVQICPRPLGAMGDLCKYHSKILHRTGSLEFASLKSIERRPFIAAASTLLQGSPVLSEMTQLLESCKPYLCPQADTLRRGWTNKEKARAILAQIHRQHGEHATLKVLAAFLGTAAMPMPTSAKRFAQIQQARAVYHLLRSEKAELFGRTRYARIGMHGYRLAVALYELVDAIAWPLRGSASRMIRADTLR